MDVLRLDLLHPVISGNKWFKLKYYLQEAVNTGKKILVTFGGAYSNHIVAAAAAAKEQGLQSAGIIRGEKGVHPSPTLMDAMGFGMELYYTTRENYKTKQIPSLLLESHDPGDLYFIPEGGYGEKGAAGAEDILDLVELSDYSHIMAAAGTGTMLAGLIRGSLDHQQVTGIPVLKNNFSLEQEIEKLLPPEKKHRFTLLYDYHFGGYAKYTRGQTVFMNEWYQRTGIPSDFVYTAKLFFAVQDLVEKKYFPGGSRLLVIHSGGLQGNRSLDKGTLIF